MIVIYTDGSAIGNPGPAGYAWVVTRDSKLLSYYTGVLANGTNNQAEMMAAVGALMTARDLHVKYPDDRIVLVSDSLYVLNGIPKAHRWGTDKKKPNWKLWQKLYYVLRDVGTVVELKWVRGHDKTPFNNKADKLAYKSANTQEEYQWTAPEE